MAENRIILGGKTVLHLDGGSKHIPISEPALVASVDWLAVAAALGLTPPEQSIFLRIFRDEMPLGQIPPDLGISTYEATQTRKRMYEKLGLGGKHIEGCLSIAPAIDSLRPVFHERLPSGRRVWSAARLGPDFPDVMLREKFLHLICQRDPEKRWFSGIRGSHLGAPVKPIDNLKTSLATERNALARISDRLHQARLANEGAEDDLKAALADLKKIEITSIVEDSDWPGPELRKRLTLLQNDFRHRQSELEAAEAARTQQASIVEKLEAELLARRVEVCAQELSPLVSELRTLVAAAEKKALECRNVAARDGLDGIQFQNLLVPYDVADPWAGSTEPRFAELRAIGGLFILANIHAQYGQVA